METTIREYQPTDKNAVIDLISKTHLHILHKKKKLILAIIWIANVNFILSYCLTTRLWDVVE